MARYNESLSAGAKTSVGNVLAKDDKVQIQLADRIEIRHDKNGKILMKTKPGLMRNIGQ